VRAGTINPCVGLEDSVPGHLCLFFFCTLFFGPSAFAGAFVFIGGTACLWGRRHCLERAKLLPNCCLTCRGVLRHSEDFRSHLAHTHATATQEQRGRHPAPPIIAIERFVQAQKNQRVNFEPMVIDTPLPIEAGWRLRPPRNRFGSQNRLVQLQIERHTSPTGLC
jgi:hypothetical protein